MYITLLLFLFYQMQVFATPSDLCDVVDIPNCRGVTRQLRRNTFQSAPTSATASNLNPANVRFDKGLGVEGIFQSNNPVLIGLTSGTGKMGGALISGSMDNTFFGNRVPEHDEEYLERFQEDKQFRNNKYTLALGGKLFAQKNYGLDVGAIFKRHNEVEKINPGAGFSARIGFVHFGASQYRDDYDLDMTVINDATGLPYSSIYGKEVFQETFTVTTLTAGVKIKKLALDVASISSKLDYYRDFPDAEKTNILIYSAGYYHGDFLFNAAIRKEHSGSLAYDPPNALKTEVDKSSTYYGVQYSVGRHIIIGVSYNYFLLKEVSGSIALFI